MVAKFSVWLYETARLYKRYATVGLVSLPFAFAWAWTARVGWNQKVVFPVLAGLALAAAKVVWRRMGDWQLVPLEVMSPFEEEWAELLTLALQKGATLQYRETVDADTCFATNTSSMQKRQWSSKLRSWATPLTYSQSQGAWRASLPCTPKPQKTTFDRTATTSSRNSDSWDASFTAQTREHG